MNVVQFKNMLWHELGRLPKPLASHPEERPKFSIGWHDDKHGDDWILVELTWTPPNWCQLRHKALNRAAVTIRLSDIAEDVSLQSVVHTLCDDLATQITVMNGLDYSYP